MIPIGALTAIALQYQYGIPLPPPRYDHAFKGKLVIHYMDACRGCGGWTHGNIKGVCHIYILKSAPDIEKVLIRHEIGHCNGWPGNHPA